MANSTQGREQPTATEVNSEEKKKRAKDYNLIRPEAGAKCRVVNAVAQSAVKTKIKHPGMQCQIIDAVATRIARDKAHGKSVPKIKVYDKDALAKVKAVEPSAPGVLRDSERTR